MAILLSGSKSGAVTDTLGNGYVANYYWEWKLDDQLYFHIKMITDASNNDKSHPVDQTAAKIGSLDLNYLCGRDDNPGWVRETYAFSHYVSTEITTSVPATPGATYTLGFKSAVLYRTMNKMQEDYLTYATANVSVKVPKITSSSTIYAPQSNITINWSKPDSDVSSLTLKLLDSKNHTIVSNQTLSPDKTSATYNLGEKGERGTNIKAYLTATSSKGLKPSSTSAIVGSINRLPSIPIVNQQGQAVTTYSSVIFSFYGSAITDADKQPLRLQYRVQKRGESYGDWQERTRTENSYLGLIFEHGQGLPSGERNIQFRLFDGLESSEIVTKSFLINRAPEFDSLKYSFSSVASRVVSVDNLVKEQEICFTLKQSITPEIVIQMAFSSAPITDPNTTEIRQVNTSYKADLNSNQKTVLIDILKLSFLKPGDYFQTRIKVGGMEKNEWSAFSRWSDMRRKPLFPQSPLVSRVKNDGKNSLAKSNYFLDKLTIQAALQKPLEGEAAIKNTKIIIRRIEDGSSFFEGRIFSNGLNDSFEISGLSSKIQADKEIQIGLRVEDILGRVKDSYYNQNFIKTSRLSQYTDDMRISLSRNKIRPLSSENLDLQDFIVKHPYIKTTGSDDILFYYRISIDSIENYYDFKTEDYISTTDQLEENKEISITASKLNQVIHNIVTTFSNADKFNKEYTKVQFQVRCLDGFNDHYENYAILTINFVEKPYFTARNFEILHNFDINPLNNEKTGEKVPAVCSDKKQLSIKMFNKNEGVILKFPAAKDLNEDIVEYQIYLAKQDFLGEHLVTPIEDVTFDNLPWTILKKNELDENNLEGDFYLYKFSCFSSVKNEAYWFKIIAIDSKGNSTEIPLVSDTYIIVCRTVSPIYKMRNFQVTRQSGSNMGVTINLDFIIQDLGGSSTAQGWSEEYYSKFPNFERENIALQAKPKVKFQVTIDSDFTFQTQPQSFIVLSEVKNDSAEGHIKRILDFKVPKEINFPTFPNTLEKFYVKFDFMVSTGYDSSNISGEFQNLAYVSSLPYIYTDLGEVPTVSYRKHCVGLNSSNLGDGDILTIESYSTQNQIHLLGQIGGQSTQRPEIILNLDTRQLDNIIISGGTWD